MALTRMSETEWSSSGGGGIAFLIKWEEKKQKSLAPKAGLLLKKKAYIYFIQNIPPKPFSLPLSVNFNLL